MSDYSSYPNQVRARSGRHVWAYGFAFFLLVLIASMLLTFPLGAFNVFNVPPSGSLTPSAMVAGFYLFITIFPIKIPIPVTLGTLFISLWVIYLILFGLTLNGSFGSLFSSVKNIRSKGSDSLFDNSAFAFSALFPPLFWATILLDALQNLVNVPTGSLSSVDPLLTFVAVTFAPLREELGFRVVIIGLVALLALASRGAAWDSVKALWQPSKYLKKHSTPADERSDRFLMWGAIGFSAIVFGLAHFLLGGGWGPGKISEAALTGLGLGWLYYKYGFPAAVLLHWSFNYYDWVISGYLGANTSTAISLSYGFFALMVAVGVATTAWFIAKLVRRTQSPAAPTNRPVYPAWGSQPSFSVSFNSPSTGQTEVHDPVLKAGPGESS